MTATVSTLHPRSEVTDNPERRRLIAIAERSYRVVESAREDHRQALVRPARDDCWRVAVCLAERHFLDTCRTLGLVVCEGVCGAFAVNVDDVEIARPPCQIADLCPECRHDHQRMCVRRECRAGLDDELPGVDW